MQSSGRMLLFCAAVALGLVVGFWLGKAHYDVSLYRAYGPPSPSAPVRTVARHEQKWLWAIENPTAPDMPFYVEFQGEDKNPCEPATGTGYSSSTRARPKTENRWRNAL